MYDQKGFVQTPLLIAIVAGLVVISGASYFGIKQYTDFQIEKERMHLEAERLNIATPMPSLSATASPTYGSATPRPATVRPSATASPSATPLGTVAPSESSACLNLKAEKASFAKQYLLVGELSLKITQILGGLVGNTNTNYEYAYQQMNAQKDNFKAQIVQYNKSVEGVHDLSFIEISSLRSLLYDYSSNMQSAYDSFLLSLNYRTQMYSPYASYEVQWKAASDDFSRQLTSAHDASKKSDAFVASSVERGYSDALVRLCQ